MVSAHDMWVVHVVQVLGFTNPVGTGGVLDVCLFLGCGGLGGIGRGWDQGLEGWGLVMSV